MMDLAVRSLGMFLALGRMFLGLVVFVHPSANWVAALFGLFEALSGSCAAVNVVKAQKVDKRVVGLLLPAVYLTGAVMVCSPGESSNFLIVGLLAVWVVRMWALFWMGFCYSVGTAAWIRLADKGPFAWVRHPMAATGIAARLIFCLANPEPWNWWVLGVMVVAEWASVVLEESFLKQFVEWRYYAVRVPWRFVPRVF